MKIYRSVLSLFSSLVIAAIANSANGQTNEPEKKETGQVAKAASDNLALPNQNYLRFFTAKDAAIQGKKDGASNALRHNKNMRVAFQLQQFTWKEYSENGVRLLEESGSLYGLHMAGEGYGRSCVTAGGTYKLNVYGGRVNYDGETQAGNPVKTKTDYLGMEANVNLALRAMPADSLYIKGFVGPAIRLWRRDINSKAYVSGYVEEWYNFDGRAGVGLDYFFLADFNLFMEGGYKIPFMTRENVDWSKFGVGWVALEPDQIFSPFAEVGLSWNCLFVSGFYDSLRFDKSDIEQQHGYYLYQPESQADIWGVNAGFHGEF